MGWLTEDGRHEGYLAPMFGDGQRGRGFTAGSIRRTRSWWASRPSVRTGPGHGRPGRPGRSPAGWCAATATATPRSARRAAGSAPSLPGCPPARLRGVPATGGVRGPRGLPVGPTCLSWAGRSGARFGRVTCPRIARFRYKPIGRRRVATGERALCAGTGVRKQRVTRLAAAPTWPGWSASSATTPRRCADGTWRESRRQRPGSEAK